MEVLFVFSFLIIWLYVNSYIHNRRIVLQKPVESIITISPSGVYGYYLLGIASFLKDNYDLRAFAFSGASAGAWISLIMCYRGNHSHLIQDVLHTSETNKQSIPHLGRALKTLFTTPGKYQSADFDLNRCYMGVMNVTRNSWFPIVQSNLVIYNNFASLEDAVECCIASSHVPFVMGNRAFRKYRNHDSIDGGFSNMPYYKTPQVDTRFHLHPFVWTQRKQSSIEHVANQLKLFCELFLLSHTNLTRLYETGYNDARKYKANLDYIFKEKIDLNVKL